MLRKLLRAFLGILVLLAAALAGLFGYAQTQDGKRRLAALIGGAASGPGQLVTLEGLDGFLPFEVRLARLSVADGQGVWLEVADAELAWTPSRLLRGVVDVRTAGAREVVVHRLPPSAPEEPAADEPFRLPSLPKLPASLPGVELRRLHLDRVALGEPVLGQAAAFRLEGSAGTADEGRTVQASLDLRRTDQPTATAGLSARLDLPGMVLALDLKADETGRLLAAATGRPEAGDLHLTLAGSGPLADWRGRLALDAERLASARADLALAYGAHRSLALDGGVDLAPGLLPPEVAAAVGPRIELGLGLRELAPERFALERLDLRTAAASLAGQGTADLGADTVRADFTLTAPDFAAFTALAATPLAGRATLRVEASGPATHPTLRLALDGGELAAAAATLNQLSLTAELAPLAPPGEGLPPLTLRAGGFAEGAAWDGRPLGEQGRLDLDLAAELPVTGPARVERLELRSSLATLTGRAGGDPRTLAGDGRVDLAVPDLAAVLRSFAPDAASAGEVAGALRLGADVTVAEGAKRVAAVLDGGADALRLPPGLLAIVGPTPTLAAAGSFEPGVAATVDRLELAGAAFRLEGDPRLGLADQALGGAIRLAIPDLRPLAGLLGQPVEGAVELATTLAGTLGSVDLRLDGTGRALQLAGQRINRLTLAATARGEPASSAGAVRLTAERGRAPLTLATDYRLAGGTLDLSVLSLDGPGARLAGAVAVALDGPRATGGVAGQVRDLASLAPWIGQELSGGVDLDLRLDAPDGRQNAKLGLGASRVAGGFGRLQTARLDAAARDLLGRPALDASLLARGFAGSGVEVAEATLAAKGPLTALALDLATTGDQAGRPFRLRSAATVDAASARRTVRLASLDAAFAGEPIRLTAPATLTLSEGGGHALDRLALEVAGGSVTATGELGGGRVRAEAAADGFPLALLETFGGPSLRGTASAKASLSGSTGAPEARAELTARDLALDAVLQPKPDLRLEATLAGGRLDASLALSELGSRPVTAAASLPARFRLEPPTLDLAADAPLTGALQGQVDLSRVARVAALQGVQLAGSLQLDLAARGTLADPALAGTLALSKGVVQDVASGVNLRDVELAASGQGRRLVIDRLSAMDRAGGTLAASGWVGLEPPGGLAYALDVQAGTLRVLDNSLGTAILSGGLRASGTAASAQVGGALTVDRADIAIPDTGGPSVPVIEVREVNTGLRSGPERPAPPAEGAAGAPFDLRLAVTVDVPARLFVRGRGLDSEWGGKLTVDGPATAPEIVGELEFRRGFLDLLDKRFTIRRGVISFVGSTPPIPMLDLEASARSAEIEAVVKLRGPAAEPELTLTSEPVLPQDEILARLLFGSSVARLTPVQGLRLAAAVSTLQGGGGIGSLLAAARKGLGVDTLDVEGGETAEETTARAGKYVSDNVYLEVEKGVAEGSGKARVKVELTPNLLVGTEVNEQSQTGVGVEWRYDY